MIKILFGVGLTLFVLSYGNEIKQFVVEIGIRDKVVEHLKYWGDSCRERVIAQSGVWHLNQAATRSTSVTSTPSLNFTPVITLVK